MTRSRNGAAAGKGPRPIVTYSHMPPEAVEGRVEPRGLDPDATVIDAVEVPLVAEGDSHRRARRTPDLRAAEPVAPDLRADPRGDSFGDDEDLAAAAFEPEARRRRGRGLVALIALVAIAGGIGAVAASLGVFAPPQKAAAPLASSADAAAELIAIHKQIDALGAASTPEQQAELATLTKRLAELEQSAAVVPAAVPAPASDDADIGPAVRQISLTPGGGEGEAAPAAAPPAPRPRPESLASRPAAETARPEEDMPVAEPLFPPRRTGVSKSKAATGTQSPQSAPTANDENFIASVEKALSSGGNPNRPEPAPAPPPVGAVAPAAAVPVAPAAPALANAPADDNAPIVIAPPAAGVVAPAPPALPKLDAEAADPYALPAPIANAGAAPDPPLPPGFKLPPADIPNVPPDGSGQQY